MIKKSANRNQRSKGVKVKHVLQILVMLCICFWLLYQIKCLYDRHRELSEKASKTLAKEDEDESGGGLKLGRKDLQEKQREDEYEEGNEGEDGQVDDEEIRRDVERMEEEERLEEKEHDVDVEGAEGRGEEEGNDKMDEVEDESGGDDAEINEGDADGGEAGIDREEDFLDEDKGGREERDEYEGEEDNDGGDKEEPVVEDDEIQEDKDPDGFSENTHEAREAHYQADDASDAVVHDTHTDNENADEDDSNVGVDDRLTEPKTISLSENAREATAVRKAQENSNAFEGDKQPSHISGVVGVEITGSRTNVAKRDIDLPLARRLAAPNNGSNDVSFEQTAGTKTGNASTADEDGNQTESTRDISTRESTKPLDLLNIQMVGESDNVSKLEKNQEGDHDRSKTLPFIEYQANVIRMQLLNEHDSKESRKR